MKKETARVPANCHRVIKRLIRYLLEKQTGQLIIELTLCHARRACETSMRGEFFD